MRRNRIWIAAAVCIGMLACLRTHPSHPSKTRENPRRTERLSAERRSDRQLDAARRLLDAGRMEDARTQLEKIRDDHKAPQRNRGRALWLILKMNDTRDPEAYWKLLERFPSTVAAEDALREFLRFSRQSPSAQVRRLLAFYRRHPDTFAAELALMESASLAERMGTEAWKRYAVHLLTFLARHHPDSPYRDAALYRAAEICRFEGRIDEAILLLKKLLQMNESSFFFGDYNSEWMDDAQLLLGELYFSQGNRKAAIQAWSDLPRLFPRSRLRDRAWMRLMQVQAAMGRRTEACLSARTLLGKMPHSRFSPQARIFLAGCGPVP